MIIGKEAMSLTVKSFFLLFLLGQPLTSFSDSEKTIIVENGLQGGRDLLLHCESADDDLGVQLLHPNTSFRWKFQINVFGTTSFHCSFQWDSVLHKFVIYKTRRDHDTCSICNWIVKENGPCLILNGRTDCYNWNSLEER